MPSAWVVLAAAAAPLLLLLPPAVAMTTSDAEDASGSPGVGDPVTAVDSAAADDDDADADAACVNDDALRLDADWQCAVARARCLAREHKTILDGNSTECGKEVCSNLSRNFSDVPVGIVNNTYVLGHVKLFCRTTTSLVWHWTKPKPQSPIRFVASVRQENGTWLSHDVVSDSKFIIDELPPDTKFQLKVQAVMEDGNFPWLCSSKWISTLNDNFKPLPVINVTVAEEYQVSEKHVNMSIQWKPNKDMTCDYIVRYWNEHELTEMEEMYYHMEFTALLSNLNFNNSYKAFVLSGDNKTYLWGESKQVNITTPSCLDVWNNNLSICIPLPPETLEISFLELGVGRYAMNISWKSDRIIPERYSVFMTDVESNRSEREYRLVDGNTTSMIFKNVKPATIYMGCVSAISSAGNSTMKCKYRKFKASITKNWEYGEIVIVIVVSLSAFCIIVVIILYFCYRHNKKRRENVQRCQSFENLEKEPPKEEIYESSTSFFDDEWEIPYDHLLIGDILGEGAFGVVHKGLLQGKTGRDPLQEVAVKMLRDEPNVEEIRQFQQEISMMKSVGSHPHIVSIIGCCTSSKQARLIVEYCALGDLQNYLRQNLVKDVQKISKSQDKLTEHVKYAELMRAASHSDSEYECHIKTNVAANQMYFDNCAEEKLEKETSSLKSIDLLSFGRQIAMGMEFLASNRIVHRDLAARNVLVCANKTVKISDFGLSRDIYEQNVYHKKGNSKLPIKWMAIESLLYQVYTTQSDIWSFGILLWEIVTFGGMPYPSTPASRIFQLLKTGYRMECPPNCSQELYDIMLSCWRAKPKDRPTFIELHKKLDSLLEASSSHQYLNLDITNVECLQTFASSVNQPPSDGQ